MSPGIGPKPVFWVGSSHKDLQRLSPEVRKIFGFAIWQAQVGRTHLAAKPLKGFGGASVLEVVEDHDGSSFRAVYTVRFARLVYALHVFQKKSKKGVKTPKQEIELIRKRLQAAEEHYAKWRNEQESEAEGRGDRD
jgi:phage-related protein